MEIGRRKLRDSELLSKAADFLLLSIGAIRLLKNPIAFLSNYVNSAPARYNPIRFRNGYEVFLSNNKLDVVTIAIIFCRKDYGPIPKDSIILDIGSNIGAFAMYAAFNGAKKVYGFEPNSEAYECLLRNVHENGLEAVIYPFKLAVSDRDDDILKVPLESDPNNIVSSYLNGEKYEGYELCKTISIEGILKTISIENINLMKMDCEGSEYKIIMGTDMSVLRRIREIRMEYHRGNLSELVSYLERGGFEVKKFKADSPHCGYIWFSRVN